jgi:hypothetical protein
MERRDTAVGVLDLRHFIAERLPLHRFDRIT